MRRVSLLFVICTAVLALPVAASADTVIYSEDFESGYGSGVLGGNGGWSTTTDAIPVGTGGALTNNQVLALPSAGISGGTMDNAYRSLGSLAHLATNRIYTLTFDVENVGADSAFGFSDGSADYPFSFAVGSAAAWRGAGVWVIDPIEITGNANPYNDNRVLLPASTGSSLGWKLVVDGPALTASAYYNAGSGYVLGGSWAVDAAHIEAINALACCEDYRFNWRGIGVDNIVLTSSVPEPGALTLLGLGALGLLAYAWRKRK
jgi:hypothetical protein